MDSKIEEAIERVCRKNFPNESCGVILYSGQVIELPNVSKNPKESFSISILDFYKLKEDTKYVFHCHTKINKYLDIRTPSLQDCLSQENLQIPFLIAGFDGIIYTSTIELPTPLNKDFLDRPYIYGISDCGYLMRDYYWFTHNILLEIDPKQAVRPKNEWADAVKTTLIKNNFIDLGCDTILQEADIIIESVDGDFGNHGAIYLGNNQVLAQNKVSEILPLEDITNIYTIYRHKSFL